MMEIPKNLRDDIWEYCRVNNIPNVDEFTINMMKQGFTAEKYGATPFIKEPEVIEKVVEVEVIKEVEVPVEKIVTKTVEVEKEVYITDDSETKKLTDRIEALEKELSDELEERYKVKNDYNDAMDKLAEYMDINDMLHKELEVLKVELREERGKEKKVDDIYDETKRGHFGSNTSEI